MPDEWANAHSALVSALELAKAAGVDEDEVMSAVDDVYHEDAREYIPGPPKPAKKG